MSGRSTRQLLRSVGLLLALLACAAKPALAQYPEVWFEPEGKTFYGANQQVKAHICDPASIRDLSTKVWLRGTQITTPAWTQGDNSCAVHHVLTINVALVPGSNLLEVKACETIDPLSCATYGASYTYATPDPVKPTLQIATAAGSYGSSSLGVTVNLCDDYKLNPSSTQFWLNNVPVTVSGTTPTPPPNLGCYSSAAATATLTLPLGPDTFKAVVRDSAGNVSDTARAIFTFAPPVSVVGEPRVRRPGLCAMACFDATVGYSTAPYTSLDAPRSVSLVYNSSAAKPRALIQLDVNVGTGPVPNRIGVKVRNPAGGFMPLLHTQQTEVWYTGAAGTNRVPAWFDATSLATGTYRYTALVTREYGSSTQVDSVSVPVIVVNESASAFGAGWSLANDMRVVVPTGAMDPSGVTVVAGDGTAVFYTADSWCGSGPCGFDAPPSEFSTLKRTSTGYVLKGLAGDSTTFTLTGQMTGATDRFGNVTSYWYYDQVCSWCIVGKLGAITDPAGKQIYLGYDPARGVFSSFNVLGVTGASVTINSSGNLTTITDYDNVAAISGATYDAQHRLTGYADRAGNAIALQYDSASGKLATVIGPAYRAQGSTGWRDTTRIVSYEKSVLPAVNAAASSVSPAPAVSPATVYAWVIGSRNDTTRLHLDGWRAADQVRDPLGYVSSVTRNANAQVTSTVDPKGNTTTASYDGPRVTGVTGPDGGVGYEYDLTGRVTRESGNTAETRYCYSTGTAWVVDSVHVEGQGTTRYTYDSRGRMLTQRDSADHTASVVYEATGFQNTRQVIEPGSRTTTFAGWDSFGRATQVTAPDNSVSQVTYDILGRVTTATAPSLGVTRYYYGAAALDSVKDARNQVFRWTRNQLGWVETEFRPDDNPAHRTAVYDRYGRVVSSTDRRGQTVGYWYDTRDRVAMMVAGTDTTRWAYSPDQPGVNTAPTWLSVQNALSVDTLHYDVQGRLSRAVTLRNMQGTPMKYEVAYAYNTLGGVDTLKYRVNGGSWEWSRFGQNLTTGMLSSIRDFSGRTTSLSYNGEGALRQVTYPNTQVGTLWYTSTHQLSRIGYSAINLNTAAGVGFSYDSENRISRRSSNQNRGFRDFTYDGNGRLASHTDLVRSASHPSCQLIEDQGYVCTNDAQFSQTAQRIYTYDLTDNPTDRGALIGLNNRLNGYDDWTMSYDMEGNMTGRSKAGSPTYGYTWDALGRLSSVQVNGTTVASYGYDGMGRRIQRNGSGGYRYYVYQGDDPLLEVGNGSQILEEYTYVPGGGAPFALRHGGIPYWFHTDPQGSVLAITDQYGNVANQYKYAPYGAADSVVEAFSNRLRHAGREWDADAGLYYNRARWYDPQMQRFISQDPIGIDGGLNLYAYAGDDPVNGSDPSGLITCVKRTNPVGHYIVHKGDPIIFDISWECDYWGAPASFFEDLRTLYGTQCTAFGCPCQWLEACTERPPTPAEWAMIRTRIDEIVSPHPICQSTRDILDEWYKEGRNSGRYVIWDGDVSHGPGMLVEGRPTGTGLSFSSSFLMGDPSRRIPRDRNLVVHEGLHIFANRYLVTAYWSHKWGDVDSTGHEGRGFVYRMQARCRNPAH